MSKPRLRQDVFDSNKRKSWDCASQSNEMDGEWGSSSAALPINRRKKFQPDWTSARSEEVGDSDELHHPGRQKLGQTSKGSGKGKIEPAQLREEPIADDRPALKIAENNTEDKTNKTVAICYPKAKESQVPKFMDTSLNTPRSYMQNVLEELGESRKRWLQWMRQEMHNILHECSSSPGEPTNLAGKGGEEMKYDGQGPHRVPLIGNLLGCENVGMKFGGEGSTMGRVGSVGQGNGGDAGYCDQSNSSGGELHNVLLSDQCKSSRGGVGMAVVGEKDNHMDASLGSRNIKVAVLGEKTRETAGFVGLYKGRVGITSFGRQTEVEFHTQPDLRGYSRFGAQGCDGGGIEYGSDGRAAILGGQAAEKEGHDNGKKVPDIRSSGNPSPSNQGVGSSRWMSLTMPSKARATDLMGMQSHGSVGMQNPLVMNMVWNMMQQSQRSDRHAVPSLQVSNINYEEHAKTLNGGTGPCRGMIHSSSSFQSTVATVHPVVPHYPGMALGAALPSSALGNTSLSSSSGMPSFIGMDNLVAIRNSSSKQDFLGISTNGFTGGGSMNRQGSPAAFMQHNPHQSVSSGRGASVTTSPGMSHKFCSFMQSMDTLELNT